MALFNISVLAHLTLPEWMRRTVQKMAVDQERAAGAAERTATALEALVAKMNEPDPEPGEVPPMLHDEIDAAAADAEALRQAQAPPGA